MSNWHTTEIDRVSKLCDNALAFTINDCREAIAANPDNPKCGQYQDTIHYCHAEQQRRLQ
ncbi:hypothetical protein A3709_19430 [Halioglobus sp. HI00S01]|uniref:hypothetical protein n=1 Tax=Halioglobus sp. HI00S01 TaxID=1822214 RepID=UPI0007C324AD|nr:hypothetical protein [Halioglobus sp. HI00S01]KZX57797.1 hypothetical protein A3709_19430 [Halioglobus sp. HI00S01]